MNDQRSPQRRQISVAIVDDDASVRVSLQRLCEAFGLQATAYASGREFLATIDSDAPRADCLLLDAHMPEMTGIELARHLDARGVHLPTIVFTGDDAPDISSPDLSAGITRYLRKPLSATILIAAIEQTVSAGTRRS
jgi:FixJ family two-component response regulator